MPDTSASIILDRLNSGEMSKLILGQYQYAKYNSGFEKLYNFVPLVQGPVKRRQGTIFAGYAKSKCWLITFGKKDDDNDATNTQYTADNFIIELGTYDTTASLISQFGYARFWQTRKLVTVPQSKITTWVQSSPYSINSVVNYNNIYYLFYSFTIGDTSGTSSPEALPFSIASRRGWLRLSTDSLGGVIYEIPTLWTYDAMTDNDGRLNIKYVQSKDVIFIGCPGFIPQTLSRYGVLDWRISRFGNIGGPFNSINTDDKITSGITLYSTLTSNIRFFNNNVDITSTILANYNIGDVIYIGNPDNINTSAWQVETTYALGALVIYAGYTYKALNAGTSGTRPPTWIEGAQWDGAQGTSVQWQFMDIGFAYGRLTATPNVVTWDIAPPAVLINTGTSIATYSTNWALSAWNKLDGYPVYPQFFKGRLVWCDSDRAFMSESGGAYYYFRSKSDTGDVTDAQAIFLLFNNARSSGLQWIISTDALIIGTNSTEFAIKPITLNLPFGPRNVEASALSTYGSSNISPARINETYAFVQRNGYQIRDIKFDSLNVSIISKDQTILNPSISSSGIVQLAYQQGYSPILWAIRKDGLMIGFTYSTEAYQESPYGGWFRVSIGTFNKNILPNRQIDNNVACMATLPSINGVDDVCLVISSNSNALDRSILFIDNTSVVDDTVDPQSMVNMDFTTTISSRVYGSPLSIQDPQTPNPNNYLSAFTNGLAYFNISMVGKVINGRVYRYDSDGKFVWGTVRFAIRQFVSSDLCNVEFISQSDTLFELLFNSFTIQNGQWGIESNTISLPNNINYDVVVDGQYVGKFASQVTLPKSGLDIQYGISFTAQMKTFPLVAATKSGASVGQLMALSALSVRVIDSGNFQYGTTFDELYNAVGIPTGGVPNIVTTIDDDVQLIVTSGMNRRVSICIQQSTPDTPLTIASITAYVRITMRET